jgi:hypothetical protein
MVRSLGYVDGDPTTFLSNVYKQKLADALNRLDIDRMNEVTANESEDRLEEQLNHTLAEFKYTGDRSLSAVNNYVDQLETEGHFQERY